MKQRGLIKIYVTAEWENGEFTLANFHDEVLEKLKSIGFEFYPSITDKAVVAYIKLSK